jgi:predicted ATPase
LIGRSDREALTSFAPFVAILQWLVRAIPPRTLRKYLADIDGGIELARLVPGIARRASAEPWTGPSSAEGHRYRMFEAFAELLRATSSGAPVLLLLEDMQWADGGSLQLLRHLSRSVADAAVCIIVTCRESEAQTASWDVLDDLRRELSATRIVLGGLSEDDVHRFVGLWLRQDPAVSLTRFLAHITDGNPLFVGEMLRHLQETGLLAQHLVKPNAASAPALPDSIRELIRRRLSRLSEASQRLLSLASVVGREFSLSIIEALAELPEAVMLDAIDEAAAARIIVEDRSTPGRFAFTNTLIRETLYGGLMPSRRVRWHHRVGEAIERQ